MIYKVLTQDQVQITKETLYEAIPITGTLMSGTYGTWPDDNNVLKFTSSHGLFESLYDYPYASSSANQIMDLTFGLRSGSLSPVTQSAEKFRIYNQMAQTLLGFDATGSVRNFIVSGSTVSNGLMFLNISRLLTKDGIKVGSFTASMGTSSYATPFNGTLVQLSDNPSVSAESVKVDSPAGQYWYVYTGSTYTEADKVGLLFYQQGVLALDLQKTPFGSLSYSGSVPGIMSGSNLYSSGSITEICDGYRRYVNNIQFQNTVQINSTIYNCQVGLNEFNYSSNPTYTSGSQIRTKSNITDPSTAYITTIGLYSEDNQLLAVAKLSEPLKKTQADAINLRVRLDY
jgi:hypothetical protein